MNDWVFPLPRPESGEDARFCIGLSLDVAEVLTRYGYPDPTAGDLVQLQMALFAFLYEPISPDTDPVAGKER